MRGTRTRTRAAAIAIGGATGSGLRWAVVTTLDAGQFPWPVLALNIAGSILLGALLKAERSQSAAQLVLRDAVAIGFCGGLTTFSTFALEVVDLVRAGRAGAAFVYAVASIALAILGVIAGAGIRRRSAPEPPLARQP